VWSPVYVNALVLRDQSNEGYLDQRLYVLQDANWNVTTMTDVSGTVVERYAYSPFGATSVYAADWTSRGSSLYNSMYLFQGGRYDAVTKLTHFGIRDFDSVTERWMEQDPIQIKAGDNNYYRFVGNRATNATDPSGKFPEPPRAKFPAINPAVGKLVGSKPALDLGNKSRKVITWDGQWSFEGIIGELYPLISAAHLRLPATIATAIRT